MSATQLLRYGVAPGVAATAGNQRMSRKSYYLVTAIVFSVVGLIHLLRIILGWEVTIGGWTVPMWLSWLGLIVSAVFAYFGFTHARSDT
jgi:hypothetical protein